MTHLDNISTILINCHQCPRLVAWREQMATQKRRAYRDQVYWGKPVPGFGDPGARILVVGLAPGAHGSNRTGRMFTGDASGDFLYQALFEAGFASQPESTSREDDLKLSDLFITAVCRCAPPDNKPTPAEIHNCLPYLQSEISCLPLEGIICLGKIAFDQIIRLPQYAFGKHESMPIFSHGAFTPANQHHPWLFASYHPSRQNTQTGRLTRDMFRLIWELARTRLDEKK